MAKYRITPSSRTIVQSPISIGHKAEKGVEAIEFDVTAWVETYGSGTLTVIMRRWGDAAPYPIALEIDENNKATWALSDIDTAKAGMAYAQLSYVVGDEVVKKSDIYTFRVMDSLTGEGEQPEAYESWLEHLTHLAAEAMAEVLDIEGVVTDKTLTVDGGIADAKATGDALSALEDQFTEETDKLKADLADAGMPPDAKAALLACLRNVAWTNAQGQSYYNTLEVSLGMSAYPKIVATFNPGVNVIYTDDALDTLKQYMTVKYVPSQGASGTTISASEYTLSGTLSEGANAVLVSYGNYKTAISVIAVDYYNITEWSTDDGMLTSLQGVYTDYFPILKANTGSLSRGFVACNRGKKAIVDFNTGDLLQPTRYPIPVPVGATGVTVTLPSDYAFGFTIIRLVNNEYQDGGYGTGWSEYGGGSNSFGNVGAAQENTFMGLRIKGTQNISVIGPPNPVKVVFTFN